jgi:hypothetical protein
MSSRVGSVHDLGAGAPVFSSAASRRRAFVPADANAADNRPPKLIVRTQPRAGAGSPYPVITGIAPLTVLFNLCQSEDPDMVFRPDGTQDPSGDSLNWQFHFGDGKPISQGPDAEHTCRVEHTYKEGSYVATVSVTDKHQEDQGDFTTLARVTEKLTIVVSPLGERGPAACEAFSSGTVASSLNVAGPLQDGRLFRDGIPSSCAGKAYPGAFNVGTPHSYRTFGYSNPGSQPACFRVDFDPNAGATPCGSAAHAVAYLGAYDPTNQAAGYLGDVGSSITQSFSFQVPGGAAFTIVVNSNFGPASCTSQFAVVNTTCP